MIVTSKRPSDVIGGHQTNQAEWRPIGPFVNNSHPDHATIASIYEEINDLHEETVDIVLAYNWEVKRQLVALKKDISLHCVIHMKQVALVHAAASHPRPSGLFS